MREIYNSGENLGVLGDDVIDGFWTSPCSVFTTATLLLPVSVCLPLFTTVTRLSCPH